MGFSQTEIEYDYEGVYEGIYEGGFEYDFAEGFDLSEYGMSEYGVDGEYELGGFSKKQKSQKFRQDRNFPAHKKTKSFRRKKLH